MCTNCGQRIAGEVGGGAHHPEPTGWTSATTSKPSAAASVVQLRLTLPIVGSLCVTDALQHCRRKAYACCHWHQCAELSYANAESHGSRSMHRPHKSCMWCPTHSSSSTGASHVTWSHVEPRGAKVTLTHSFQASGSICFWGLGILWQLTSRCTVVSLLEIRTSCCAGCAAHAVTA